MATQDQRFSTRLGTLLTMAGLAIGLGNVWRFPYMMGQHGGSAFLLVYCVFMLLLAVPALTSEWALGRSARSGPVLAFRQAFGRRTGTVVALALLFSAFMAACYYSIVVANVLYSAGFAAVHGFGEASLHAYGEGLGLSGLQYGLALGVVLACLFTVHRGLRRGIEAVSRALVPLFGLAALYLVFVTLGLDGAPAQLAAFLRPDFGAAGPSVWFAAMGQACFSVGLSGTICVMYGAYLRREERLLPTAAATCSLDLGAALLASLFIVPAVLVFGLDLAAGPGLLFDTLPRLFGVMPGGRWLAPLFLLGWALVAMLTLIAVFDTLSGALAELRTPALNRRRLLWPLGFAAGAVMLPIAWNPDWIGLLDLVFGSGMFMLGALLAVLAVGWGAGSARRRESIAEGLPAPLRTLVHAWVRFVVPAALAAILFGFLYATLAGGA